MPERAKVYFRGRGKDSEALKEGVEEGTRVYHPSRILDQDSILSLETRHPAKGWVVFWGRGSRQ